MDITLERILSLLPKKEDGKFVHGSKKEFARQIGYESGEIISLWISGESTSYKKKLHEISAVYGVSVEWLKGETDQKEMPTGKADGLDNELVQLLMQLTPEEEAKAIYFIQGMIAGRR